MPSDSNARGAVGSVKESEGSASGGEIHSGKTAQARILSETPPAPGGEPVDSSRALLAELTVGTVVDGKYRVDEVLGRGAMGVVVAAIHTQLGERVALKFLRYHPKPGSTDDFQSRFKREARVSAKLKNEHITRVIDVGVWRERVPYMVMDYLTGVDLRQVIKSGVLLPVGTALDYAVQVCEGIAEAHSHGVVHRDLKPSNLFVTKRPDGSDLVKILDFGISKWTAGEAELDELTQTGVVLGSPKYMAPEQLFGSAQVDTRADVWSIGAILYEMLTGHPPFDFPTFTKICAELATDHLPPSVVAQRPEVSPELEAVVMRCFVRAPEHRTQNVAELAGEVLDAVQAPFANQMRAKISAMMGARGAKDALAQSGPASLASGSYGAVLSQSGSGRHVAPVTSPVPPSGDAASRNSLSVASMQDRRRWGLWIGVGAVLVLGAGGGAFALSGHREGGTPAQLPSAVATLPPPATAVTAAATQTATATTATATTQASATATATALETHPPPIGNHGGWRPRPHPTATAAAAATTAPPATTQPVATAPPPATTKSDPLGERQ
jgi:serine/threonine-protein kinase